MIYQKLYKRTATGAVQEWSMECEGNKYRTISGKVDGKLVTSKWTEVEGKNLKKANATTPEEQATREVEAKYEKQKTSHGYMDSPDEVDSSKHVRVMLANDYNDYKDELVFPVYSQPKLDGIRCRATARGLYSRNDKEFVACPHISKVLEPFFKAFPDIHLDGELYADKLKDDFNEICSLIKRTKPTEEDFSRSANGIQYWIYDVIMEGDFAARQDFINTIFEDFWKRTNCLVQVKTELVQDQETLDRLYAKYMDDGNEGQMIRSNEVYQHKRTKHLLKRKEWVTEEFEIVDVAEGDGNRSGMAGRMFVKDSEDRIYKVNVKGNFAFLTQLLKNKKRYIGKEATVKYFNRTEDNDLRFPYVIGLDRKSYE